MCVAVVAAFSHDDARLLPASSAGSRLSGCRSKPEGMGAAATRTSMRLDFCYLYPKSSHPQPSSFLGAIRVAKAFSLI